ncbi:MAG: Fic family protein, partial [Kofleriaceae bacterium]
SGEPAYPGEFEIIQGRPGCLRPLETMAAVIVFRPTRVVSHIGAHLRIKGHAAHDRIDVTLKAVPAPPRTDHAEQRELSVAQYSARQLEVTGGPSVQHYGDMLAAVLAARTLTDRANPDDTATQSQLTRLLEPVAKRLNELNDHQGRLAQFGAGNIAGQASLDMSEAAVRSWLQLSALGAKIRADELVTRFRAGAESIRFLTGERSDAPTLRAFNHASSVVGIGAASLILGPALIALAAEEAALLAFVGRVSAQRIALWALTNPAAALAASEALLGFGVQIGEDGWESFWDQLRDPQARWFIIVQVFMDYMHVRGGVSGHDGSSPGRSSAATGEQTTSPDTTHVRQRASKMRAVVQQINDAATTGSTRTGAPTTGDVSPPSGRRDHGPDTSPLHSEAQRAGGNEPGHASTSAPVAKQSAAHAPAVQSWAAEQTELVQRLLDRPIPPAARSALVSRWQRIREAVDRLTASSSSADSVSVARVRAEVEQLRQEVSTTIQGDGHTDEGVIASRNWKQADAMVRDWARARAPLTLDRIKTINQTLESGLGHNGGTPGELRKLDVAAGGSVAKMYVPNKEVPAQMASFVEWYQANEATMPPIELAARAYQRLVSIHPFLDANGRTSRLVMDWILQRNGLPAPVLAQGDHNVAVFWSDAHSGDAGGGVTTEQAVRAVTTGIERVLAMLNDASSKGAHRP